MDENNEYYEDDENLVQDDLFQEESGDIEQQPSVVDNVGKSAAHGLGKAVASHYGGSLGGKAYDAFSQTAIGKALEEKAARKLKLKIYLILIGVAAFFLLFIVIISFFIDDGTFGDTGSSSGSSGYFGYDSSCDYEGTTVTVMNLDKTEVLATVSLEDYIIGVACIEVGACNGASSTIDENYVKSQYVASKTYALERGGYDSSIKSITIRSSTVDQGWCDLEYGCYMVEEKYSDGNTYNVYYPGTDSNPATQTFTEEDLEVFHQWYQDIYGELFLTEGYSEKITTLPLSGSISMAYKSTTQNFWSWMANQGNRYDSILVATANPSGQGYTQSVADTTNYVGKTIYKLASACSVTTGSSYAGLDSYPLNGGGATKLARPITEVLTSSEIEKINSSIIASVDEAGRGTGAGVAAAATALMMGLYENGYYLPYYYGGGHSGGITVGVDLNWGKTGLGGSWNSHNAARGRYYYSYDCSAFVSWAIKNSGCSSFSPITSGSFLNLANTKKISFNEVTSGDVFTNSGHIILVVKNNGDGTVTTAESTTSGVVFRNYTASDVTQYSVVDMDGYYSRCSGSV